MTTIGAFASPTRKGLVIGLALVALEGRKDLYVQEARHHGYADYTEHSGYRACRDAIDMLTQGLEIATDNREVVGVLAFAQQTARVSNEEWDQCVRVKLRERA